MTTFQFDLILSGIKQASHHDLQHLENELTQQGCLQPNPRNDKYGVRVSIAVEADSFTQAIYLGTQYIGRIQGVRLSVRSVEFN
ncbi:hypothetical protein [Celerinatantimonas yamalensis]|uniref:Uncharacterized protein n=1 Tax=Celerinatantimonas yamalensis TaxID=559956 RepID=A0ABW9G384_9GAMM